MINRGRVVVADGKLHAERGSGQFIPRGMPGPLAMPRKPSETMRVFQSFIQPAA